MSKGPGTVQRWIVETLQGESAPLSIAKLCQRLVLRRMGTTPDKLSKRLARSSKRSRSLLKSFYEDDEGSRSTRNSLTRALRTLEKAGTIKRNDFDEWSTTAKPDPTEAERREQHERTRTAYHEAGHAVAKRYFHLQVGLVSIIETTKWKGVVWGVTDQPDAIGETWHYDKRGRLVDISKGRSHLDPFGHPVPPRDEPTEADLHGGIVGSIAGPMAEAQFDANHRAAEDDADDAAFCREQGWKHEPSKVSLPDDAMLPWRPLASDPGDITNVQRNRRKLGDKARSWPEYECEALKLVREQWHMIEAVAAALLKHNLLSGFDLDCILQRVARADVKRQHLKKRRK